MRLKQGDRAATIGKIFHNPDLPTMDDYYEPFTYKYADLTVFGEQIKATTPEYALYGFAAFYLVCLVLNWWFYTRKNAYIQNP